MDEILYEDKDKTTEAMGYEDSLLCKENSDVCLKPHHLWDNQLGGTRKRNYRNRAAKTKRRNIRKNKTKRRR
jgi:hypothetical protein